MEDLVRSLPNKHKETPLIEAIALLISGVYDHTVHAIDIVETFRDIVSGILDIYLARVNLKLNEVMKVLTVVGMLFLPLAFTASVYGMNFRNQKWLQSGGIQRSGLPPSVIVIAMLVYFRRKQWILQSTPRTQ